MRCARQNTHRPDSASTTNIYPHTVCAPHAVFYICLRTRARAYACMYIFELSLHTKHRTGVGGCVHFTRSANCATTLHGPKHTHTRTQPSAIGPKTRRKDTPHVPTLANCSACVQIERHANATHCTHIDYVQTNELRESPPYRQTPPPPQTPP